MGRPIRSAADGIKAIQLENIKNATGAAPASVSNSAGTTRFSATVMYRLTG
jgi:hypothetical protein